MKHAWKLAGIVSAAWALPAAAQPGTADYEAVAEQQVAATGNPETSNVRYKTDDHDRMTVAVKVSDEGPYRFLVDTGADRTAVSREIVEALKLPDGRTVQLHTVTGSEPARTAIIDSLQFAAEPIKVVDAPVLERAHVGADGILALDSLRSQRVQFDFRNKTMSVTRARSGPAYDEPGTIVVKARALNSRLVLSKARADGIAVSAILDTGAEVCIGNEALRQRLLAKAKREPDTLEVTSVTGRKLVGTYTFVKKLELGGVALKDVVILFADAHAFKQLGLGDKPALLLGMNAMRAFDRVSIDFAQRKLRLTPPEELVNAR